MRTVQSFPLDFLEAFLSNIPVLMQSKLSYWSRTAFFIQSLVYKSHCRSSACNKCSVIFPSMCHFPDLLSLRRTSTTSENPACRDNVALPSRRSNVKRRTGDAMLARRAGVSNVLLNLTVVVHYDTVTTTMRVCFMHAHMGEHAHTYPSNSANSDPGLCQQFSVCTGAIKRNFLDARSSVRQIQFQWRTIWKILWDQLILRCA